MLTARDTSASRAVKGLAVRDASGALRNVSVAYARDAGNILRTVFSSGAATASPDSTFGTINSKASRQVTTSATTLTISSGTAPFSIVWTIDDSSWSVTNPTGVTTAFRSPSLPGGEFASASAFATVTDANGTIFTSNMVSAFATNTGLAGT